MDASTEELNCLHIPYKSKDKRIDARDTISLFLHNRWSSISFGGKGGIWTSIFEMEADRYEIETLQDKKRQCSLKYKKRQVKVIL